MGLWVIVGIGLRALTMSQNDIVKCKVSYYNGQLLYLYGLGQILSISESFDDNRKLHYQPNRTSWNERSNRVEPTGGVANMGFNDVSNASPDIIHVKPKLSPQWFQGSYHTIMRDKRVPLDGVCRFCKVSDNIYFLTFGLQIKN